MLGIQMDVRFDSLQNQLYKHYLKFKGCGSGITKAKLVQRLNDHQTTNFDSRENTLQ